MLRTISYLWLNRQCPHDLKGRAKTYTKRVWTFPSLIAILWRVFILELQGATILELTTVSKARIRGRLKRLHIGTGTAIGECEMAVFSDIIIGNNVVISDGVRLLTASHNVRTRNWDRVEKPIIIEDYAWIATGAIILPGVTIGRGSVVAAGTVLAISVPANALVKGNPGTVKENIRPDDLSYSPTNLIAPFEAWIGQRH